MDVQQWSDRIGRLGVWAPTDVLPVEDASALAVLLQDLGYGALWVPETLGRDPFAHVALLADRAQDLVFATGIANIHHRLPGPMLQAANTLAEQTGGRFLLGIGVSHQPLVEGIRHVPYGKPLATMRAYLDGMDSSMYLAPAPTEPAPRLLAALGPMMLDLAAERADGAHTYWVTPEHTAVARAALGPDKLLCVEHKVVLTDDPALARTTAEGALGMYIDLPNYRNNWLRLGYTDEEIDGRASRFLDAVVAWGDADALRTRVQEHLDAGADHVCIQALTPGHALRPDHDAYRALAPAG